MKKNRPFPVTQSLPWEEAHDTACDSVGDEVPGKYGILLSEQRMGIQDVSRLLDRMVMDIQHLELEVIRERYRLSFYLEVPFDEYLKMEIFSGLGGRYTGDPVYEEYLRYRGFHEYEDAIDTPFHLKRKLRLADGYDDYPDLYP